MTGMWGRSSDGFLGVLPSDAAWTGEVTSVGGDPAACGGIKYLLPEDGGYSGVPGQGILEVGGLGSTSGFTLYTATCRIQ